MILLEMLPWSFYLTNELGPCMGWLEPSLFLKGQGQSWSLGSASDINTGADPTILIYPSRFVLYLIWSRSHRQVYTLLWTQIESNPLYVSARVRPRRFQAQRIYNEALKLGPARPYAIILKPKAGLAEDVKLPWVQAQWSNFFIQMLQSNVFSCVNLDN